MQKQDFDHHYEIVFLWRVKLFIFVDQSASRTCPKHSICFQMYLCLLSSMEG